MPTKGRTTRTRLARLLRLYRLHREKTLRDVGQEIGLSAAAVMRIEQGRGMDHTSYLKVLFWLETPDVD